jgi:hypothetical protein
MRWLCGCALVLALGLNGCSCGLRGTPGDGDGDGGRPDAARGDGGRDGATPDGWPHPDAGPWLDAGPWPDGGTCDYTEVWHLESRAISRVSHVNGTPPRLGVTEQLLVEVPLYSGSCEALAGVSVTLTPGGATDSVHLWASVWQVHGTIGCSADAPIATTVVTVPGRMHGNLNVVVSDGNAPSGGVRLSYQRQPCSGAPACQCSAGTPNGTVPQGGTCLTDCSCAAGLACLGYYGFAGELWTCERPCADSRDCDHGSFCAEWVGDGPSATCMPGSQCGSTSGCPEGFACQTDASGRSYCQDLRTGPTWEPCQCDADCSPGNRCIWDEDLADCLTPCRKDSDCPTTGGLGYGYCEGNWVCMYYWE